MNREERIIEIIKNARLTGNRFHDEGNVIQAAKEIMALDDWNYNMGECPRDEAEVQLWDGKQVVIGGFGVVGSDNSKVNAKLLEEVELLEIMFSQLEQIHDCTGYVDTSDFVGIDANLDNVRGVIKAIRQALSNCGESALVKENTNLKAELKALQDAVEWQPIESAPKDYKTRILAIRNDESEFIAVCFRCMSFKGKWMVDDYNGSTFSPTHWQPLPEPPVVIQKESK